MAAACGIFVLLARLSVRGAADPVPAGRPPITKSLDALRAHWIQIFEQSQYASASWGAKVVSLDSGKNWIEYHPRQLLKPASNNKLFTAALALDQLGPDFRIRTSLFASRRPDAAGRLEGDLLVYGRGDPSFSARFHDGAYTNLLAPLADALVAAGVKKITGRIIGDESFFRGPPLGSAWTWDDLQFYYGAEVSALTFQDNTVDLFFRPAKEIGLPCHVAVLPATEFLSFSNRSRTVAAGGKREIHLYRPIGQNIVHASGALPVGGETYADAVTVHDPALWFVTMLREALMQRGIDVGTPPITLTWLDRQNQPFNRSAWIELAAVESPPVREIVTKMMKVSQNLYAQLLLLQVGERSRAAGDSETISEDLGLVQMQRFLAGAGVKKSEALLEEGSGLSRGALVTPNALVGLLQYMDRHRQTAIFRNSLPLAGVDGSLKGRMRGTAAEGNLQAKTGSLRYVTALSGYVKTKAGERLAFSILLNNYAGPASARDEIDKLAATLAEVGSRF